MLGGLHGMEPQEPPVPSADRLWLDKQMGQLGFVIQRAQRVKAENTALFLKHENRAGGDILW
jgi:hypothetical protein